MKFARKIVDSNMLNDIIDIPEELRNRRVEIIVLPYEDMEQIDLKAEKKGNVRGALAKYRNEKLLEKENEAWQNAVVENCINYLNKGN